MLERDVQVCAKPALWRADVVARSREVSRNDGLLLRERMNGVGQLNLTVDAMGRLLQALEDLRAQDVATDNSKV